MGRYFDYLSSFAHSAREVLFATDTSVLVFLSKYSFGCMHQTFMRCLVMVQKSFGLTFTNVSGAPEALVSYFKWFGGQPDGKVPFPWGENGGIDPWREPLKQSLSLNNSYLIQYLLTVDLKLETCFTIDSSLKT